MNARLLVLFIHVVSATLLVGGSMVALPAVGAAVRRARSVQELRTCLSIARPVALLAQVSSLVLLATGIYLATSGHFWSLAWVQVAVVFWVVNSVIAGRFYKPAMMQLGAAAFGAPDGPVPGPIDGLRRSARATLPKDLLVANNTALLYQMVVKPGLTGSLLAVAIANAVVLLGSAWLGARQPASPQAVLAADR